MHSVDRRFYVLTCLIAIGCGASAPPSVEGNGTGTDTHGSTGAAGSGTPGSSSTDRDGDTDDTETTGGQGVDDSPFSGGTRLRPRLHDAGGGARRVIGWYDTELGIDCSVHRVMDGELRCIPIDHFTEVRFLDAGCTQPIVVSTTCDTPEHVGLMSPAFTTCYDGDVDFQLVRVGASLGAGQHFAATPNGCEEVSTELERFAVTLEDTDAYAEFSLQTVDRGDGLGTRVVYGPDGSHQWWRSAVDLERNHECEAWRAWNDSRCVSYDRAHRDHRLHLDGDCEGGGVATTWYAPDCAPPSAVLTDGELYEVGPALNPAQVFERSNQACAPPITWGRGLFRIGNPMRPEAFPETVVIERGTERLATLWVQTRSGADVGSHGWYDRALDMPCFAYDTAAGLRCLPGRFVSFNGYWGDSGCSTTPLVQIAEGAELPSWRTVSQQDHCQPYDAIVRLEPASGTIYRETAGECQSTSSSSSMFARVVDQMNVADLPAIDVVVD